MVKSENEFYFSKWGYTRKDFQKWGRKGGLVFKYSSNAERQRAYRRRKTQAGIDAGLVTGVLNLETGRVRKWRNNTIRQKAYWERKKSTNETNKVLQGVNNSWNNSDFKIIKVQKPLWQLGFLNSFKYFGIQNFTSLAFFCFFYHKTILWKKI